MGGVTFDPSRPMGQRGLRWWKKWGRDSTVSPPVGMFRGGNLWENHIASPRTSPQVHWGLGWMWVMMANAGSRASWGGRGTLNNQVRPAMGTGPARPVGWGMGEGSGRSAGRERGIHPLFSAMVSG
jgi:hypothetical protein